MAGPHASRTHPGVALLTRPGCPGTEAIRSRLDAALPGAGLGLPYEIVDVSTLDDDDPRRGYPTPTILLDGRDLFGMPSPPAAQAPT